MNSVLSKSNFYIINTHCLRFRHTKHWNPKYKRERKEKILNIIYPTISESDILTDFKRKKFKSFGILPCKPWIEEPIYISCTGNIFEPYIPPEGDGKFSSLSAIGAKKNAEYLVNKTKSYRAMRKIKKYEEEFEVDEFADQALNIYIKAYTAVTRKQNLHLKTFITEKLFPEILYNLENKIITWKFIKSLEPPRIVHLRCTSLLSDDNVFAQITVRLHTEQVLAIYDRFGRLMYGSEILKKDVLEYIVFEKHLSNDYGQWRLHSKIVPKFISTLKYIAKTFVLN